MITKTIVNYVNKNNCIVTQAAYDNKLELFKQQALSSITISAVNYNNDIILKGKLESESYTDISMSDIYFFKADNSYTIFVTLSGMRDEFEHIFYYVIENAPIYIINKLKKYI